MFGKGNRRLFKASAAGLAGVVVCASLALWMGGRPGAQERQVLDLVARRSSPPALTPEMERQVEAFCGDCHALPLPESFHRDRWHFEVWKGYEFYIGSGRTDLSPPPLQQTLAYFRSRAPQELALSPGGDAPAPPPVSFQPEKFTLHGGIGVLPEIAHLHWAALDDAERPVLLACDMRYGHLVEIDVHPQDRRPPQLLARLNNPCQVEICDLDQDGAQDVLVADLGSFMPADHDRGRVVLLHRRPGAPAFAATTLADGLGRVADVRAADVDGDEDLDLLVAEFGWFRTGGIVLLRNVSAPAGPLRLDREKIDPRPGAIHLPVHDFNGDGRPDFVALMSQEHESVELFLNAGEGRFDRRLLWSAPDLMFGSSGIELTDLDGDGDQDILYTNGDAFDNTYVSPWHGVQWLENRGGGEFASHRLTDMPCAYRALAGDLDGDGDLDVVATAWLPPKALPPEEAASLPSLVWLEQTRPGAFVRHTLERGAPYSTTLEMADFDGDGDLDFAVGSGPVVAQTRRDTHYLTVWWSQALAPNP